MNERRIVLLGKTGDGKSSCGNLILGEEEFQTRGSPSSQTQKSNSKSKTINEREIQVVDTPGFFDTMLSAQEFTFAILRCIIECEPGPHAFVIVLKVARYTKHERETVEELTKSFGDDALKYAVVLFTHGDQLCEGQTIEDFVNQSTELQDLVNKCGGRVHVVDNKYWKEQQDVYRSNRVQVEKILNTIEEMVEENGGECYTNEMLQAVHKAVEAEYKTLCEEKTDVSDIKMREQTMVKENEGECYTNEMLQDVHEAVGVEGKACKTLREQAKQRVHTKLSKKLVGLGAAFLTALLGTGVVIVMAVLKRL